MGVACLHVSCVRPIPELDVSRVQHVAKRTLSCLAPRQSGEARSSWLVMSFAAHVGLFAGGILLGAGGATLVSKRLASSSSVPSVEPVIPEKQAPLQKAVVKPTSDALQKSGHPGPIADFLRSQAYVTAYDRRLRHPVWTAEHLTSESIRRPPGAEVNRAMSVFTEDERIPMPFRSTNSDYFGSGYDRGHMVPAADAKSSQAAMNETFLLTNIAPQVCLLYTSDAADE